MAHRARFFSVWRGKGSSVNGDGSVEKYDLQTLQPQSIVNDRGERKKRSVLKILQAPRRSERRVKMILVRDILMLINAMSGLFVAIALLELSWNGQSLKNTWGDQVAKYFLTISTAILVMQVIEYNVMIIYMRMKDMKNAAVEKSIMRIKNPTFLMVWNNSSIKWKFWMEILMCLPHPFPGIGTTFDKVGTLLMFGRLFILVKVMRDLSPIWNAKAIPNIPGYSHAIQPTFTAWRAFKAYFYGYPVTFVTILLVLVCMITTYAIYIFERESQESFTFAICFYITITSMFLGWPSDVFNQYNAITWGAKIISIIASVIGIFLFALLIDYLHSVMQLSYNEKFIYDWLDKQSYDDKIRDEAARLIQAVWKHFQWKKHKDEVFLHSGVSKPDQKRLTKKERKAFNAKLVHSMKGFQQARRRKFMRFGADDPSLHPGTASAPSETFWEFTRPTSPAIQDTTTTAPTTIPDSLSGGAGPSSTQPSINDPPGPVSSVPNRGSVRVAAKRRTVRLQSFITPTPHHPSGALHSMDHPLHPAGGGGSMALPSSSLSATSHGMTSPQDMKAVNDYIREQVEQMRREMIEDMKYLLIKQKEDLLDEMRRGALVAGTFSSFVDHPSHMSAAGSEPLMFATPPTEVERRPSHSSSSSPHISPTFPSRLNLPIPTKREKGKEKEDDGGSVGSRGEVEVVIDRNMDLLS